MRKKVDFILERLLLTIITIMLVSVIWQVFSRYVLGSPSTLTDEIASFSLIWLGLYGAAYATGKELHLAIDLVPTGIVEKSPVFFSGIVALCIIIFAVGVMIIGGSNLCLVTYELHQMSAALKIPLFWIYSAVPISGLLIVYYSIDTFLKGYRTSQNNEHGIH